jgi:hypothetical protein
VQIAVRDALERDGAAPTGDASEEKVEAAGQRDIDLLLPGLPVRTSERRRGGWAGRWSDADAQAARASRHAVRRGDLLLSFMLFRILVAGRGGLLVPGIPAFHLWPRAVGRSRAGRGVGACSRGSAP